MLSAFLITVLPTLFMYLFLSRIGLHIKSTYLRVAIAWFAGLYVFTFCTFFIAVLYSTFTSAVLVKATYTVLLLVQLLLFFFVKELGELLLHTRKMLIHRKRTLFIHTLVVLFCLIFSYLFFSPHLKMEDGFIYRSPIYWDFHWHAGLIQSFVLGDNFPPQNESFGGLPHTYHYFWAVAGGMYAATGLDLVGGINFISILAFFFLLLTLIGCSEAFFKSKKAGVIAVLLMVTSSSFHFIYYFLLSPDKGIIDTASMILTNTNHPFTASLIRGNPFEYSGTMFNLFYFLEERQMIFGVIYLLLSVWVIFQRSACSNRFLFVLGLLMGAYFLWHLHITIMVLCALLIVLLLGNERKKTAILLAGFAIVFGGHYLHFKEVLSSDWFYASVSDYPKFNNTFSSGTKAVFTWPQFFGYYGFAYGLKIIFLLISVIFLWRKNKQLCILLLASIIPAFILLNTIQLSPAAISENHKWLRPMNVIIDLTTAYAILVLFFKKRIYWRITLGILFLYLLTISGIIELMPFMNSQATKAYSAYPSPLTRAIIKNTAPKDIIVGQEPVDIHLSGRKMFVGNTLGGDMNLKVKERKRIVVHIYQATDIQTFCERTQKLPIDWIIYFPYQNAPIFNKLSPTSYFTAENSRKQTLTFVSVKKACTIE